MTVSEIILFLESRQVPFCALGTNETGRALVIEEGARVLALSAPAKDENVLWNHPALAQCRNRQDLSAVGIGGMGGIRLWQAPEQAYMWNGTPEPKTFSNYQVQEGTDPGNYKLEQSSATRCIIKGKAQLQDYRSKTLVEFEIQRIIEIGPLSKIYDGFSAAGLTLRFQNHLHLKTSDPASRIDLWHLIQLPAGSIVGASLNPSAHLDNYFNPGASEEWVLEDGRFLWKTNGRRISKVGLSAAALKGGPFAIRELEGKSGIYLWNIPIWNGAGYVDSSPLLTQADQVVQFWDGFGFCEVEYHSPGASLNRPDIFDTSELTYLELAVQNRTSFERFTGVPS